VHSEQDQALNKASSASWRPVNEYQLKRGIYRHLGQILRLESEITRQPICRSSQQ
jgi:hypothetical protein